MYWMHKVSTKRPGTFELNRSVWSRQAQDHSCWEMLHVTPDLIQHGYGVLLLLELLVLLNVHLSESEELDTP